MLAPAFAPAARAFPAWRDTLPKDRAAVLHRWHALILEHADALGRLISLEQGKPFAEGRGEVLYGASYVAWFADEATRIYGDIIPQQQRGKRMCAVKEPVGIVAAITPWNSVRSMGWTTTFRSSISAKAISANA